MSAANRLVLEPDSPAGLEPGVSVVIPVYNSEATLAPLVLQVSDVLGRRGVDYEILLVNDASRDRSWDVVRDLAARHPNVRGFDLMRNYGQHNALLCGIRE